MVAKYDIFGAVEKILFRRKDIGVIRVGELTRSGFLNLPPA